MKIPCSNVQFSFQLVHAHKAKFGLFWLSRSDFFFLLLFLPFFSAFFFSLPFTLHLLPSGQKCFDSIIDKPSKGRLDQLQGM